MEKLQHRTKRVFTGIVGCVVVIIGIIAIPYPGPGWLIVFTGLAILATEFTWARRVLTYAKGEYDAWERWLGSQVLWVKLVFWLFTCIVVIVTLWLFNGYGLINNLFHLDQDWLYSPFFR